MRKIPLFFPSIAKASKKLWQFPVYTKHWLLIRELQWATCCVSLLAKVENLGEERNTADHMLQLAIGQE